VALKALREDLFRDEKHLDLLRREVRAAREVVSPNVCRIFDLIEADGSELVSMEYVDGGTLLEVLQERGPLDLKEAQDIASQFLAGLEAIHRAGLVHRDVKPENIMITRAGRVLLMDFGLARQEDSGSGTVAGTPAYMAPEQAAGQKVDARADVYAAGVVLAEMVSPEGIKNLDSRKSIWKGVRSEPAQLPDSPWAPVLKKAVAKEPDQRYNSAHTLTRALEDVTPRVEGAEDLTPYPGLASFTESDAEYFFGREAEIEQMWRKTEGSARLLGLVGPSGAGKTSFIRAGLIPGAGTSWSIVRCTPGNAPFVSLGQALAPETAGDPDAMRLLPRIHEIDAAVELVSRWCRRGTNSLLVVDQFEELFTQNPPEVQDLFAGLLARLPLEAEAHVLLSVFEEGNQPASADTLNDLIGARLLTSYEVHEEDEQPHRTVEIIHESLLAAWPRLVRWQTQDADAAQLRDQLRQAARTWDEHERSDDLLWTGSAYREYASWRERYPGGLSDTEEAFGSAMKASAGRRRRRRRVAVAAAFAVVFAVLAVISGFWRQSVREGRRAEAQKLIALGQLELDSYPTAAVAYATSSLELADSQSARRLAVEALWKGPTAFTVSEDACLWAQFSPNGSQLVQAIPNNLRVFSGDGSSKLLNGVHGTRDVDFRFSPGGDIICSWDEGGHDVPARVVLWSAHDLQHIAEVQYQDPARPVQVGCGSERALILVVDGGICSVDAVYPDGSSVRIGTLDIEFPEDTDWYRHTLIDSRAGRWLGAVVDNEVFFVEIAEANLTEARRLGRHGRAVAHVAVHPWGRFIATIDDGGRIILWDPFGHVSPWSVQGPEGSRLVIRFSPDGSLFDVTSTVSDKLSEWWIWSLATDEPKILRRLHLGPRGTGGRTWDTGGLQFAKAGPDLKTRLWPPDAPTDADPVELLRGKSGVLRMPSFHPQGNWLVTTGSRGLAVWPLTRSYASIIRRHTRVGYGLVFGPNGRWLASSSLDTTVRIWPLEGEPPAEGRVLLAPPERAQMLGLAVSPAGDQILVGAGWSGAQLVPLDGGSPRVLQGFESQVSGVAFSPDGRLAAAVGGEWEPREKVIRVWDVVSGEEVAVLGPDEDLRSRSLEFTDDDHLVSGGDSGLLEWDLVTGRHDVLFKGRPHLFAAAVKGRRVLLQDADGVSMNSPGRAVVVDLETGIATPLDSHGDRVVSVAIDSEGTIAVTGGVDGVIRVGRITGEQPHLLLGHEQSVEALAVDPLGRWIASSGEDTTVRLWPIPDLSKPPLPTLPREELIAKLKSLTNLCVVRDKESSTGWKLAHEPFPGWETVPTW
jgi:WD40 repeat protein